MYLLNRVTIIGHLEDNPEIYWLNAKKSIAIFTLLTPIAGSDQKQRHHILVDDPQLVEYVASCLSSGQLVFVEGQLEHVSRNGSSDQTSWVVVSKTFGGLHPIASHVHTPECLETATAK